MSSPPTKTKIEDLLESMQRSQKMLVDNVGIVIDAQKSYETFASRIGKTVNELTENQKCQAFFDALAMRSKKRGQTL